MKITKWHPRTLKHSLQTRAGIAEDINNKFKDWLVDNIQIEA